jgi:myo-inositol-1(or 4)-monophosphatase
MYQDFLTIALHAVAGANKITLESYWNTVMHTTELKNNDHRFDSQHQKSPVTNIDKQVEQFIKDCIREKFPQHWFIGEEYGYEKPNASYKRIIDPIDGTRNFIRWLPYRATLIALSYNNEIIVSVVSVPVLNHLVWATKWWWAFMNYQRLQVSTHELENAYVWHSRPSYFNKLWLANQYFTLSESVAYTKSCISRDMIYVASGSLDGVITAWWNYYDNAPFKLIVEEAWWKVTTMDWKKFDQQNTSMIASNWIIHDEIVAILAK